MCVCVSGQLWRVIKQTATVISFAFFIICCWWRERKTADKIWPSASDWLWVHKASSGFNFSWGGSPRSHSCCRSRSCRPRPHRSRSSCDKNVTVSVKKPKEICYISLSSQVRKIFKTSQHHPLALYHHFSFSFFVCLFLFLETGYDEVCVRSFVFVKYLL